jgi:hypothetical protein
VAASGERAFVAVMASVERALLLWRELRSKLGLGFLEWTDLGLGQSRFNLILFDQLRSRSSSLAHGHHMSFWKNFSLLTVKMNILLHVVSSNEET